MLFLKGFLAIAAFFKGEEAVKRIRPLPEGASAIVLWQQSADPKLVEEVVTKYARAADDVRIEDEIDAMHNVSQTILRMYEDMLDDPKQTDAYAILAMLKQQKLTIEQAAFKLN